MNALPGNNVRILEDAIYFLDDVGVEVRATKGSLGTILSFDEYKAHVNGIEKSGSFPNPENIEFQNIAHHFASAANHNATAEHLALVKSSIEAGTHFPVRFYEYVSLPEEEYAKLKKDNQVVLVSCQVGGINVLPVDSFVVFLKE